MWPLLCAGPLDVTSMLRPGGGCRLLHQALSASYRAVAVQHTRVGSIPWYPRAWQNVVECMLQELRPLLQVRANVGWLFMSCYASVGIWRSRQAQVCAQVVMPFKEAHQ